MACGKIVQDVRRLLAAAFREQRLGVLGRQLGQELPAAAHAFGLHQEDELVRGHPDRDLGRDLFQRQVEDLAGGRVAERRDEDDVAVVETRPHRLGVDAAHLARELHVDTVAHAQRLGGDEIAGGNADARTRHRRVGDPEREQRLDARADLAVRFEHAVHRLGVGDAQAERVTALDALLLENGLDLRPRAMDDDEMHAEAVQQIQVVDDAEKRVVRDDFAAEGDDERLAAERVDIRRRRADPLDERARGRGMGGRGGVGIRRHRKRRRAKCDASRGARIIAPRPRIIEIRATMTTDARMPASGAEWVALGEHHLAARQVVEAAACYERAVQLEPNAWNYRARLGRLFMATRQFDAAEIELRHACTLKPDLPDLLTLHAYALREQNQAEAAIAVLGRALAIDPQNHAAAIAEALMIPPI